MGSGKKSTKKQTPKRRDQTDGTGTKEYEEGPMRFCSMDQCLNHENLKECGRCKCAAYCSVECQRKNWTQHKPICNYNVAHTDLVGGEPILQRNLRNWVARFDATLLSACIRGLNLKYEWERIGQGALMIFMEPRPHLNVGSRWRIQNVGMFRNEGVIGILEKAGLADQYLHEVLPMHNQARARLQKSSGGMADFASVITIAMNVGLDALEGDHDMTMRFTPVNVWRSMVAMLPAEKYEGDWCQDLKDQVHNDHPLKHVAVAGRS
ncbi:hypothetical protein C8R44DRAFT_788716 [Mycena epipterygia]|nr:hypothetical protein C8R44DRAFT_788716 [Mycena epipterygia]